MWEVLGTLATGAFFVTIFYGPSWIVKTLTFPQRMFKDYLEHRERLMDKKIKLAQLEAKSKDE